MKKILNYIFFGLAISTTLSSCQDVIDLQTQTGESQLVVDGWITTLPGTQAIKLSKSAAYFDNSAPKPALGASVSITDNNGKVYVFTDEKKDGNYLWKPANAQETLGKLGGRYQLSIMFEGESYLASSRINRVPKIDSVAYEYKKPSITPTDAPKEGYLAEFFANDFTGAGDCYWIKSAQNGKFWSKADGLNLAFDAGFSAGSPTDGLMFISPLRRSITPENGTQLYADKDVLRVELYSITLEAFDFLFQVRQESSNQGLFATPPNNIPTNVKNVNTNGKKALGFFGTSAVSVFETTIDAKKARKLE